MAIDGVRGRIGVQGAGRGTGRLRGGFQVPDEAAARDTAAAAAPSALAGAAMLALQETMADPVGERAARRQGQDMLAELALLQRGLLSADGPSPAGLRRLAGLAAAAPQVADPRLRDALAAIRLRAVVELARYGLTE